MFWKFCYLGGVIVWGVFVLGGNCPGGNCPGVIVRGVIVLEPLVTNSKCVSIIVVVERIIPAQGLPTSQK